MKVVRTYSTRADVIGVELTRTNLRALLAKLDGHPEESSCMVMKDGIFIRAVEDSEHYSDRPRGEMHPETEAVLQEEPCQPST